jgi:hypothetical protein
MSENVKITFSVENGQAVANIEKVNSALGNTDKKTTSNVASLGMMAAKFTVVAGAVLGAGAAVSKFVSAAAESERAQLALNNALKNSGQYTEKMMKQTSALADEILRTTTIDDEMANTLQALAINMGATGDQISGVVKGAIGFNKAFGIDMETGIKVATQAVNGNFDALARYLPGLKSAKTEAEKMAIVQKAMASGFKLAQDETNTFNGALAQLKNATGNAQEALGGALIPVLSKAAKELTNFISSKEGMKDLENIGKGIAVVFIVIKDVFKIVYETIKFQISNLVNAFKTLFTVVDKVIKKDFKGALATMVDATKENFEAHKDYGKKLVDIYKSSRQEIEDVVNESNQTNIESETDTTKNIASELEQRKKAYIKAYNKISDSIQKITGQIFDNVAGVENQIFSIFSQLNDNKIIALENEEKKKIDSLNKELLGEEEYKKQKEAIEAEYNDKIAVYKKKQAEYDKRNAIFEAVINTAQAMVKAFTLGPILGPIMAGVVGALGGAQIAAISSQPIPEFEDGGIIPASAEGTLIRAGEKNKQEMIIPFENEKAMSKLKGLGSTTIHIHVENLMADDTMPAKVAKRIDEALYNLKRKGQSVYA